MNVQEIAKKISQLVPLVLVKNHVLAALVAFLLIVLSIEMIVRFDIESVDENHDGEITFNEVSLKFSLRKEWWRYLLSGLSTLYVIFTGIAISRKS